MILQIIINILIAGSIYSLIGLGFSIIYVQVRFIHFTHAALFTLCPYITYLLIHLYPGHLLVSGTVAIILTAAMGCSIYVLIYRHLMKRRTSSLALLLVSLGIYIIAQNMISMFFGDQTRSIRTSPIINASFHVFSANITLIQIITIAMNILAVYAVYWLQLNTRMGKAFKAASEDNELAQIVGIDTSKVVLWGFALGSALAGISGILVALDLDLTPTMGLDVLLMGIVAVFIGGLGNISRVAFGAYLLALIQNITALLLGNQWQDMVALLLLIVFLLTSPEGFRGDRPRKVRI